MKTYGVRFIWKHKEQQETLAYTEVYAATLLDAMRQVMALHGAPLCASQGVDIWEKQ